MRQRAQEIQRLDRLLEDAGIKLSSVAADISGVSGRAMLEALIGGQRDPAELAELAKRRMRSKIPALTEALTGRFTEHHAFLARLHLDLIDQHAHAVEELTTRIEVVIKPFRGIRDLITTIPGISFGVADVIIAETGADMSQFPTAAHLASWAGTCPGNNESAGRVKSTKTRPGNPYLNRRRTTRGAPARRPRRRHPSLVGVVRTCSEPLGRLPHPQRPESPVPGLDAALAPAGQHERHELLDVGLRDGLQLLVPAPVARRLQRVGVVTGGGLGERPALLAGATPQHRRQPLVEVLVESHLRRPHIGSFG